ncbi:MAG: DUF3885 domain-containing protein [Clostridia bacterium]|nr:DUF3885 domain-containing protein [Clostridia bacterium]
MLHSPIETLLLSPDFAYLRPWFYENPYALRCELGQGDDSKTYMQNAYRCAKEIFAILFPSGQPDAVIFDQYVYETPIREPYAHKERAFFNRMTVRRHVIVPNLRTYEDEDGESEKTYTRDRVVSYRDGKDFPVNRLIRRCIWEQQRTPVGFVSFDNDCILSIYDDRGCDVVFATHEKLREFYPFLNPYFLKYDAEEMKRRYEGK